MVSGESRGERLDSRGSAMTGMVPQLAHAGHAASSVVAPLALIAVATAAGGWFALRRGSAGGTVPAIIAGFLLATAGWQATALATAGWPTLVPLAAVALGTYGLLAQAHALGHRRHRAVSTGAAAVFVGHRYVEGLTIGAAAAVDVRLAAAAVVGVAGHAIAEGAALSSYLATLQTPSLWIAGWLGAAVTMPALGAATASTVALPRYATDILLAGLVGVFLFGARLTAATALRQAGPVTAVVLACVGAGAAAIGALAS